MIRIYLQAGLENDYRDGISANWAAMRHHISVGTALRYYRIFKLTGVPAGRTRRKPHSRSYEPPAYTGPNWIGLPAE